MSTIINGTSSAITFPDSSVQNTAFTGSASAITSGTLPFSVMPTGSVLQVVSARITSVTSMSSSTPASTGLTATITPKFATSRIYVVVSSQGGQGTSGRSSFFYIYKDGSSLMRMETFVNSTNYLSLCMSYMDSPATTSATTYTVYFSTDGVGTVYFAGGNTPSTITLMEIAS